MTNMYKIISFSFFLVVGLVIGDLKAQTFVPVNVTGFNHDIIAEGVGGMNRAEATTSTTFDDNTISLSSDNVLYAKNFRGNANLSSPPPFGLPDDGIITSVNLPGAVYHLASYTGNNALVLRQQNTSGTLILETPGVFSKMAFLGASSNGSSTFNFVLNFSDGTSYPTTFTVPDWFSGPNFAIKSIGRVYRRAIGGHQADQFNGDAENPRLYDNQITIPAPFDQKILTSITITKTSSGGSTGIFAINGITPINAPVAPVATAATNINGSIFTANWLAVPGATTYYLDISTSSTFSTLVPTFNNRNVGNVQSFNATGLPDAPIYYYRVRAGNAGGISASSNTVHVILQQCPVGNYIVNRQAQVDSFKILYPTCTKISGTLGTSSNTSITNLNGFSNLDSITNELVITNNVMLSDLDAFKKLKYVGGGIAIGANSILDTIQSFDNLEKAPVLNFGFNGQLKAVIGFPKLTTTNIILVENNTELISINFTSNLSTVNNFITIRNNPKLPGIQSLGGVKSVNEYLLFENNALLTDITGINTATYIKSINIVSNPSLKNLNALNAVTSVDGRIFIQNNQTLQDITGLQNINPATIKGEGLVISNNPALSVCNLPNFCTYLQSSGSRNISGNAEDCISEQAIKNTCLPPSAPTALPATNGTSTGFTANWNLVGNATNYFVDVSLNSNFTTFVSGYNNQTAGNTQSINITGLSSNTTYFYRVRAGNSAGPGPNSNVITVLTNNEIPAAPQALAATNVTSSGFTANWNLVGNANGYFIDVSLNSNFTTFVSGYNNQSSGNAQSINITGLSSNTTYFYRLRASNSAGSSPNSNLIVVKTLEGTSEPCDDWIEMVNSNFLVSSTACLGDSIHFIDYSNLEIEDGAVFSWDFGDGNTSKERDPIYKYKQTDEYTVSLQISNTTCAGIIVSKDILILGCRKGAISDLGFTSVYPTPNNGDFNIDINLPESSSINIKILDSEGKVVQQYSYKDKETLTDHFTLEKTGLYYIEVLHKFGLEATRTIVIK